MHIIELHSWNLSVTEAIEIQKALAQKIVLDKYKNSNIQIKGKRQKAKLDRNALQGHSATIYSKLRFYATDVAACKRSLHYSEMRSDATLLIAGVDVSYNKENNTTFASVVVLELPNFNIVEHSTAILPTTFSYIPGLLAFREGPAIVECFRKLVNEPDIVIFDGQGIAHPRGLGIASHLSFFLQKPTIGCAKSLLVGKFLSFELVKGNSMPLLFKSREVGKALCTKNKVKPVFISPGNFIDIDNAANVVLNCCIQHKLPEPIRFAHQLANKARLEN